MSVVFAVDLEGHVPIVLHGDGNTHDSRIEFPCPLCNRVLSARPYRHVGPRGRGMTTLRSAARGVLGRHLATVHIIDVRARSLILDGMFP